MKVMKSILSGVTLLFLTGFSFAEENPPSSDQPPTESFRSQIFSLNVATGMVRADGLIVFDAEVRLAYNTFSGLYVGCLSGGGYAFQGRVSGGDFDITKLRGYYGIHTGWRWDIGPSLRLDVNAAFIEGNMRKRSDPSLFQITGQLGFIGRTNSSIGNRNPAYCLMYAVRYTEIERQYFIGLAFTTDYFVVSR